MRTSRVDPVELRWRRSSRRSRSSRNSPSRRICESRRNSVVRSDVITEERVCSLNEECGFVAHILVRKVRTMIRDADWL